MRLPDPKLGRGAKASAVTAVAALALAAMAGSAGPGQAQAPAAPGAGSKIHARADSDVIPDPFAARIRRSTEASFSGDLALAGVGRIAPDAAQATANVVPNPGFEQGGCGTSTPIICGWESGSITQDTGNPHSGSASMHLDCGPVGCYADPDSGWASVAASTNATSCAAIGPGVHAASFWYRVVVGDQVSLDATFYSDSACTNGVGQDSLAQSSTGGGGWEQLAGALEAPAGTQSVLFSLSVGAACGGYCPLSANFDDVDVDSTATTAPIVASFTPTSGWYRNSVWIYGYNFAEATSVTFNGLPAQFMIESGRVIYAYVPDGATSGPISVTTANGTGWSSSSFRLVPPPTISSFTPSGGPVGATVDIRGANFSGALEVTFNDAEAGSFTVDSDSEIHATVPYGATTGRIAVRTGSGYGYSSSQFAVPTPTISSFTPTSGPPGTSVDIRGSNFTGATLVTFANVATATFTIDSDSEIHATVPTSAATGYFYVATPNGSATSPSVFSVQGGAPSITSFAPTGGPVGTTVDLRGDNLTGATSVTFGTAAATFTVDSDTEIHATVPNGGINSYISVVTPRGTAWSGSLFIVTTLPPSIAKFTPTSGPAGTSVDILGGNLSDPTSVTIGGKSAAYTVDSDAELHATVPAGATSGPISITTPLGTATTSTPFTVTPPPPTINSFTPTSGPIGASIDIRGSNFTGTTSVKFNGTSAGYIVDSDSEIHATVPIGTTTGPITLTTPYGANTSSSSFTVTANTPPTASFSFTCSAMTCSFDASASTDPDGTVQAYSWNFGDATNSTGKTSIHTYAQAISYTVTLTVTDNAGATTTASQTFTLIALSAHGYKQSGLEKVDLSWNNPNRATFDIYRNGGKITSVQASTYTDNINKKGAATYTYKVCATTGSICSNPVNVTF